MSRIAAIASGPLRPVTRHLLAFALWSASLLASAGISSYWSYYYTQKSNAELAVQQQRLIDLQRFRESGGTLDDSVRGFSDALVDGAGVDEARQQLRSAVARHSVDTLAIKHVLGEREASDYITQLSKLRAVADGASDVLKGQPLWQQAIGVIETRQRLTARAEVGLGSR